jgi:hypothetical protein
MKKRIQQGAYEKKDKAELLKRFGQAKGLPDFLELAQMMAEKAPQQFQKGMMSRAQKAAGGMVGPATVGRLYTGENASASDVSALIDGAKALQGGLVNTKEGAVALDAEFEKFKKTLSGVATKFELLQETWKQGVGETELKLVGVGFDLVSKAAGVLGSL